MKLGTMIRMTSSEKLEDDFRKLRDMGFDVCQLSGGKPEMFTDENAEIIKKLVKKYSVEISALGCSWGAPREWDLVRGPVTIGLVPPAYRSEGIKALKKGSDFIKSIGITNIICHAGFIPNNPNNPEYMGVVCALRNIAFHFKNNGQYFLFETGQETPVTLLRTIEDIGYDNVGINLDPANLLMYGMGNPIDAIDVLGKHIRHVHGKDGLCPSNGRQLGKEMPLGQGKVNYPAFIAKLKEAGYDRYIIIEREISGEQQTKDIIAARKLLQSLIG